MTPPGLDPRPPSSGAGPGGGPPGRDSHGPAQPGQGPGVLASHAGLPGPGHCHRYSDGARPGPRLGVGPVTRYCHARHGERTDFVPSKNPLGFGFIVCDKTAKPRLSA